MCRNQIISCVVGALALCWVSSYSTAQTTNEFVDAAVRLKQAHVLRSYERCIAGGSSDKQCRDAIERLHPREIDALGRIAALANSIPEIELSTSLAACYDPYRDYLQLIECWEKTASRLEASVKRSRNAGTVVKSSTVEMDVLERHLINQLQCVQEPNPIFAFLALEELGLINKQEMIGYDSVSCYRIHGGIEISGLLFTSICGHTEDELERQLYPDFLWRGPGTSPGQFISLGTQADFSVVARWYQTTFHGVRLLNQAIKTENTAMGDRTEVQCSNWIRD